MSATTVNAFPPLHALNSSRGWFIALIVLVHCAFFWALTQGRAIIATHAPPVIVDFLPAPPAPQPKPRQIDVIDPRPHVIEIPLPIPVIDYRETPADTAPQVDPRVDVPLTVQDGPGSGPIIVAPRLDPRFPLTEPDYPATETRLGHAGTVVLKLQILPNGRVGDVKLERSSGFVRLDEAALRAARNWRMKPGTQDGVAAAMWTIVPVKFELKD